MLFRGRGAPGRGWAEESEAPVTSGRDRDLPGASPSVPPRDGERVCRGRPAADALLLGGAVSGFLALLLRPPAGAAAVPVLLGVGALGLLAPVPTIHRSQRVPWLWWGVVTLLGSGAFGGARLLHPPPPIPVAPQGILALILAAWADEVFFRRFLYGWLAVRGAAPAVVGSAVLFAAVHLPAYGPAALPVDLAAGLLLGWQRWAAGTWTAPAATHALANLLQLR